MIISPIKHELYQRQQFDCKSSFSGNRNSRLGMFWNLVKYNHDYSPSKCQFELLERIYELIEKIKDKIFECNYGPH